MVGEEEEEHEEVEEEEEEEEEEDDVAVGALPAFGDACENEAEPGIFCCPSSASKALWTAHFIRQGAMPR